ncbi:MAG: protease modulator HflC [Gammaproteobacteria bacterium]|nr:protease modulator HflC [Gammaproteobacteria bacterium]
MQKFIYPVLFLLAMSLMLVNMIVFTVDERELVIKFKFGEIVRADYQPGIHLKIPFVNNLVSYDGRIQTMDTDPVRYQTGELKNVVVDSFVKWRISDVARYHVASGGGNMDDRLSQILNELLRGQFGKRTLNAVVSGDRAEIMDILRVAANEQVHDFGIEVIDVRIKRVDLPPEVSRSVYARMSAERTRVAKELRSQGAEASERIRADADRERKVILANAYTEAERVRGEGDAEATRIYAESYGQDEEFYSFYRSLAAYRSILQEGRDLIVMEPDSEFFRYFKQGAGVD